MSDAPAPWTDALVAARLLAVDPAGLRGVAIRSPPGPVRDRWCTYFAGLLPPGAPQRRLPARIDDSRLLGGLDLGATLSADRPVVRVGVLAEASGGVVTVPMAERMAGGTAARLAMALDAGEIVVERDGLTLRTPASIAIVALDEGAHADERPPLALTERLAFACRLDGLAVRDCVVPASDGPAIGAARLRLAAVTCAPALLDMLCGTAMVFGVDSLRGSLLALGAARAAAALAGRDAVSEDDVVLAARLVFGPRATRLPAPPEAGDVPQEPPPSEQPPETPPPAPPGEPDATTDRAPEPPAEAPQPDKPADDAPDAPDLTALTDIVLEATRAAIPADILAALEASTRAGRSAAGGSGAGAMRASLRRGRPAGTRAGDPGGGARLNLIETLRTAVPWQRLRGRQPSARVEIRRDDFRIQRFAERAEMTTIFAVDASGSAALARLAETKGAVELLLAEAYVKRTQVALIAFRGATAELLLPPTRSLTRAKRCLTDLAGGGGTPLALGIETALLVALAARAKGRTPLVVLLTDGRANIARDGSVGGAAAADALAAARRFCSDGVAAAFIDTATRPRPEGATLAAAMGARYAPLPRLDAAGVRDIVRTLA